MNHPLRRPRGDLPGLSQLAILAAVVTFVWRIGWTRAGSDPLWFWALVLVEGFAAIRLTVELALVGGGSVSGTEPAGQPATGAAEEGRATTPAGHTDVVLIVRDEPQLVVRAALLGALDQAAVGRVILADLEDRTAVAALARRFRAVHRLVAPGTLAYEIDAAVAGSDARRLCVLSADQVFRADGLATMCAALDDDRAAAVVARIDTVNAMRRVDRPGFGQDDLWNQRIRPRLAIAGIAPLWDDPVVFERQALEHVGGLRSADGFDVAPTGTALIEAGYRVTMTTKPVVKRLAAPNCRLARHRYARTLRTRLGAAAPPRGISALAALAPLAAWLVPARALQRLLIGVIIAAVLTTGARPVHASTALVGGVCTLRAVVGWVARWRVEGHRARPWVIDDLRTLPQDLAVPLMRRRGSWPPDRRAPAPGERAGRVVGRALSAGVGLAVIVAWSGFVRVPGDPLPLFATAYALVFLGASNLARRELRRVQFRAWWRADINIAACKPAGMRVIGLSPYGLDLEAPWPLHAGDRIVVDVALGADPPMSRLPGVVRRATASGTTALAYLTFDGVDDATADHLLRTLTSGVLDPPPSASAPGPHEPKAFSERPKLPMGAT